MVQEELMLASRTVHLSVDKETAYRDIIDRVDTIRVTREGSNIRISSPTGLVLATLSDYELPDGEIGTKLKYRTGPTVSSVFYSPVSKSARIK